MFTSSTLHTLYVDYWHFRPLFGSVRPRSQVPRVRRQRITYEYYWHRKTTPRSLPVLYGTGFPPMSDVLTVISNPFGLGSVFTPMGHINSWETLHSTGYLKHSILLDSYRVQWPTFKVTDYTPCPFLRIHTESLCVLSRTLCQKPHGHSAGLPLHFFTQS